MTPPLVGLKVLSLGVGAVMPEVMKTLAELGADVVKVESRTNPDFMRLSGGGDLDASAGFNEANRNKRSISVNLKTEKGRRLVRDLSSRADVVGENFRGDVIKRWGLGYESVSAVNPSVVYISSQGFGRGGPSEFVPAYGPSMAASIGHTYLWSSPDFLHAIGGGINHPDHTASKQGAIAVLAALEYRHRTGKGEFIDMSQAEGGAHMMGERYLEFTYNGREPEPMGNRDERFAPQGVYACAGDDRWCAISVQSDKAWQALCRTIGRADLGSVLELRSVVGRQKCADDLDRAIAEWTKALTPQEVASILQDAGVAAGPVQDPRDHVADSHLVARGAWIEIDHATVGKQLYPNNTIMRFSATPVVASGPAPRLGEHTDDVLREWLGFSTTEIAELREAEVLGD